MRFKKILFFTLFVSTITNAQIITDRPDQTESSSTVKTKDLQIESGYLVSFSDGIKNTSMPTSLFRYGLSKSVELRFLNEFKTETQNNQVVKGIGDLEIGTKIQLLQKETINTEIAFLSHLILPTGSTNFSSGNVGSINKLSISHNLSESTSLGYNLGYSYLGKNNSSLTYSIALGISVNSKVGIYAEPYGEFQKGKHHVANFNTGLTYLVNPNLQLDFSFGTGINQNSNYISTGISWLIKHSKS